MVGAHKMVRSRLRRSIRAVWSIRSSLGKRCVVRPQRAEDFVGGNVEEAKIIALLPVQPSPVCPHLFQQRKSSIHIGTDERVRPQYRAIDVALSAKCTTARGFRRSNRLRTSV